MSFGWLGLGLVVIPTLISEWIPRATARPCDLARAQRRELRRHRTGCARALVALITVFGFTSAMLIAAAVMVAILVPVVVLWVPAKAAGAVSVPAEPQWTRRDALRSVPFWTVSGPFALALIAQVAFIVHQIAFMAPIVGRAQAALSVSVMTIFAVIGRLTDRHGGGYPRPARDRGRLDGEPGGGLVCDASGAKQPTRHVAPCRLRGLRLLGRQHHHALPALIMQREFPAGSFSLPVLGLLDRDPSTFAGALGPGLIGLIREATGGYAAAFAVCMALKLSGAAASC